jgi:recombination protein RecA
MENEKKKALDSALATIEKQYGKGAIMKLGEGPVVRNIKVIPTGCLTLDYALGTGGLPKGRIIEIYGPESSGKTTVALHVIAECQKMGGTAAFIDAEHALDPTYAEKIGIKLSDLILSQPDSGEQALDIAEKLISSGCVDLVVIDSVAALTPKAEIDGDIGDSFIGLQARLMSQALRKLTPLVGRSETCLVFINQLREKVGVMFGSPEVTPGGKALKFYATIRLDVRRKDSVKDGQEFIGNTTKIKVVKNKLAPPFRIAEFDIIFGKGISNEGCILELAVQNNIIEKAGSWFSYKGDKIGQGKENVKAFLENNPKDAADIIAKIKEKITSGGVPPATPEE